jgi:opacity protein-like surface antigen
MFGGEHTFAYAPNFIDSRLKALITNSDLLIQVPLPKVKPYATAGVGAIFTFTDSPSTLSDIGTKFAVNYGGGVKVLPAGHVGLRFDIRGYSVPSVKFNLSSLTQGTVTTRSQTLNILEVGAGVLFSFGE